MSSQRSVFALQCAPSFQSVVLASVRAYKGLSLLSELSSFHPHLTVIYSKKNKRRPHDLPAWRIPKPYISFACVTASKTYEHYLDVFAGTQPRNLPRDLLWSAPFNLQLSTAEILSHIKTFLISILSSDTCTCNSSFQNEMRSTNVFLVWTVSKTPFFTLHAFKKNTLPQELWIRGTRLFQKKRFADSWSPRCDLQPSTTKILVEINTSTSLPLLSKLLPKPSDGSKLCASSSVHTDRPGCDYFLSPHQMFPTSDNWKSSSWPQCLSLLLFFESSHNTFMEAALRVYQTIQTSKNSNLDSDGSLAEVRSTPISKSERDHNRCFCENNRSLETRTVALPWTRYIASP